MPWYKKVIYTAAGVWAAAVTIVVVDLLVDYRLELVFGLVVAIAATMTIVGAVLQLQATAIVPVREAFMHGYKLAMEHAAATHPVNDELGKVLPFPAEGHAVGESGRNWPARSGSGPGRAPRHRKPSPR